MHTSTKGKDKTGERDKPGLLGRLGEKLGLTRNNLGHGLSGVLGGAPRPGPELLDEVETILLSADVGVEATRDIVDTLERKGLGKNTDLNSVVRERLLELLSNSDAPLEIPASIRPYVIMVVGVNGVGKTTTIAKLSKRLKDQGMEVLLAAGDTFRAAAVEQLQSWGDKNGIPVIAQPTGADAASVAHDAMDAARARNVDVVIIDTAGRQHTQVDLMEELKKIKRVLGKQDETAPHEVMLVLDAGTGQNALSQFRHFNEAVQVSGLVLTKLDGTAKGGVLVALAKRTATPVRFIGVGESAEDLRVYSAEDFVDAILE